MTYQDVENYMERAREKGSVLGLEPIRVLLDYLGNPQEDLNIIHVAGTNGKGSICTFLEAMYRFEGKKVGRYISPTVKDYLEQFQINGIWMTHDQFASYLTQVAEAVKVLQSENKTLPTAFEIETAVAFLYFKEKNTDIVILETGLGGRLDATNIISHPICTVFAEIGMDHMQFLGDSISKITKEKAGIIKDNCPCVSYPNKEEVIEVLEKEAGLHNVEVNVVSKSDISILSESLEESVFLYKGIPYHISMLGEYQIYNAATAIETKLLLDGYVEPKSIEKTSWIGRFECISKQPLFIRDGAHNIDGVKALKKSIGLHFSDYDIIFIIGVLRDKEYDKMMECLCPMARTIFTVTPPNERALPGEILRESVSPYCERVAACQSVAQAVTEARISYEKLGAAGRNAVIIAWGSLSYIGQIHV